MRRRSYWAGVALVGLVAAVHAARGAWLDAVAGLGWILLLVAWRPA